MKILYYEFKMDLLRTLRYRIGIISDIIIFTFLLCFFYISNTGSSFSDKFGVANYKTVLLLGYIAWSFSVAAISTVSNQITSELQRGTLFFKLNCKLPLQILYIGDLVSAVFVQTFIIIIYSLITHIIFDVQYYISGEIFISLIICAIGMYGIGLIVAGLSIYFKKVGSLIFLIQLCLLFITDTVPTSSVITNISSVLPLTMCNAVIKNNFIENCPANNNLIYLCFSSIIWFIIGYIIFELFLILAKRRGNLLLY